MVKIKRFIIVLKIEQIIKYSCSSQLIGSTIPFLAFAFVVQVKL